MNLPPAALIMRVSGNDNGGTYVQVGATAAEVLMTAASAHTDRAIKDVLDWGCGPGRVAEHIATGYPDVSLSGCDPDTEAIAWCQANIAGNFTVSSLYPPLPYAAESFDVVLALSVMTHLRARTQRHWLKELQRILRPGGILVATVHGDAAAAEFGVEHIRGIEDHYLDPFMVDVLPSDYYRTVLQTEAYTRDAWSDWFDIVAYEEASLELHDLVVCRRK